MTLVNIRAGQDSGYFFLQPTVDAMTYAADNGIDVVNMSFFIDPWLYNCAGQPGRLAGGSSWSSARSSLPRNRALDYAHERGVTLVAALGQREHRPRATRPSTTRAPTSRPTPRTTRTVDNSCVDVPAEGDHVIAVGAVGPSGEEGRLLELGHRADRRRRPGWLLPRRFGTPQFRTVGNMVLSAYPRVGRDRERRHRPGRHAEQRLRGPRLPERRLRLLPVPAGHLDGVAARRRRGGADRQPVRQATGQARDHARAEEGRDGSSSGPRQTMPARPRR